MPRPGIRPYECVKRAWHSERHQPIRGSLIQEIFKLVNEIHKTSTKKNKEWQEKLPVVVLKAEEIIYSKANSEAEYVDLKTLWERTNDAIDTIIRRDESTETGDFLQPCIEAALYLGCTPRRASRSQRNTNPRCYLNSNTQGPGEALMKPPTYGVSNVNNYKCAFTHENAPPSNNIQCTPVENYPTSEKCPVYPLYYGKVPQFEEPQLYGHASNSGKIDGTGENQCDIDCDLSLRLGTCSVLCHDPLNEEGNTRKRKALFNQENRQFCWQSKLPCGRSLTGRMKSSDL
ncbi:hypothetical protein ACFE04_012626 [Oxalis oulophora]